MGGEPAQTIELNEENYYYYDEIVFYDLDSGIYNINQIVDSDLCYQIYPGNEGTYFSTNSLLIYHDLYLDNVVSYTSNHTHRIENNTYSLVGGVLDSNFTLDDISLSYILGENKSSYLSFCPGEEITVSFVNDIIQDSEGDDLIINLI